MTTKNILLTGLIAVFIINLPAGESIAATATVSNDNADVKTVVLEGYLKRCVEVLHSKGYSNEAIKAECTCELDYIDQHFDIFEQMLAGSAADNQQQINNFKKQLLQCKVEP